jgi:hydrogenase-4 component B
MMENTLLISTLLIPFVGAAVGFWVGRKNEKARDIFNVIMTGAVFLVVILLYPYIGGEGIAMEIPDIMGIGLFLRLDAFRYIFVFITALIWFLATMYSTQYLIKYKKRNRYYAFFILTYASTMGIFISDNMLNLFTFFEIMTITSYFLIIHDEDEYTRDAGKTYLTMSIAGGMVLLMGLFLLFDYTGTLSINNLADEVEALGQVKYIIAWLMIIGFGVKAGVIPLHVWLPKAHPAAPAPASAILSGILLKTGVFGIMLTVLVIMKNDLILCEAIFILGLLNMFWGGFLAMFQRNIKRILAYSSMSQIGYILMGLGLIGMLGEHNNIAIHGTLFHIFNHAIFKVLLFFSAGIIYMILHELSINYIRGFGRTKNFLKAMFVIGFMAIIGMPGFSGFISKNLLHEALIEAEHIYGGFGMKAAEWIFIISSSFTVAYLMKIFIAVFVEESEKYWGQFKGQVRKRALFPLMVLSGIVIYTGIRPGYVFTVISQAEGMFSGHGHVPRNMYTSEVVLNTGVIFALGVGIYLIIVRKWLIVETDTGPIYRNPTLGWPNLEQHLYKPLTAAFYWGGYHIFKPVDRGLVNFFSGIELFFRKFGDLKIDIRRFKRKDSLLGEHKERGAAMKKSGIELKDFVTSVGEKTAADKVKENYATEIENVGQFFSRTQWHMNSIIYALFIFAIILIGILSYLILKT